MKSETKIILFAFLVMFVITNLITFTLQYQKGETKRISAVTALGQDAVWDTYLAGDNALGEVASQEAMKIFAEYIELGPTLNAKFIELQAEKAAKVLLKSIGADSIASFLIEKHLVDTNPSFLFTGNGWRIKTDSVLGIFAFAPEVIKGIKDLVLKKKSDPFWVHYFVSREHMLTLLRVGYWKKEKIKFFLRRCRNDDTLLQSLAVALPDSSVVEYALGRFVSSERRKKIYQSLTLDSAYSFAIFSLANEKEIKSMVLCKEGQFKTAPHLFFYDRAVRLPSDFIQKQLEQMTTEQLLAYGGILRHGFPWEVFVKTSLRSVKNRADCEILERFFDRSEDKNLKKRIIALCKKIEAKEKKWEHSHF